MPTVPPNRLKQLYQQGSLHNTDNGWEFTLRNQLAPANFIGVGLKCDGTEIPTSSVELVQSSQNVEVGATAVTRSAPLRFPVQVDTVFRIKGVPLSPGSHSLAVTVDTREVGQVTIPVEDTVAK